jgi:hypothetical protein
MPACAKAMAGFACIHERRLARPAGLEPATSWFVGSCGRLDSRVLRVCSSDQPLQFSGVREQIVHLLITDIDHGVLSIAGMTSVPQAAFTVAEVAERLKVNDETTRPLGFHRSGRAHSSRDWRGFNADGKLIRVAVQRDGQPHGRDPSATVGRPRDGPCDNAGHGVGRSAAEAPGTALRCLQWRDRTGHAHATMSGTVPTVAIIDGVKIEFYFDEHPPPQLQTVHTWATPRREQLLAAWAACAAGRNPGRIA